MVKSQLLKSLVKAHADGNESGFRKAVLQLAATESAAGHVKIAEQLRQIIASLPPASAPKSITVDIAQPRGDLSTLLTGGFREERLKDIVLPKATLQRLLRVLRENRERVAIESWGVSATRKLLFYGPPGCGKTLAAKVIAGELGVALMTVRLDGLFSRFLGATASHLKTIFDEMPRRPAVYLFDEFDALGKFRGDENEIGEIRRVLTAFLQLMDADRSGSIIIAATNYDELLDRAVFRRFEVVLHLPLPNMAGLESLIRMRLRAFELDRRLIGTLARRAVGLSFADASRACDDAIKSMILARRSQLIRGDVEEAFEHEIGRIRSKTPSGR